MTAPLFRLRNGKPGPRGVRLPAPAPAVTSPAVPRPAISRTAPRLYDWLRFGAIGPLPSRSTPRRNAGGEWDAIDAVPTRTWRRLVGAGLVSRSGDAPDVLTEAVNDHLGADLSTDEAVAWYVRTALACLDLHRREVTLRGRTARAKAAGCVTFFEYRDLQARAAGWRSFYAMRQARGWEDGHGSRRHWAQVRKALRLAA